MAGMQAQPSAVTTIAPIKYTGVGAMEMSTWPTAKTRVPPRIDFSSPSRGTMIRGAIASISPTTSNSGPDCWGPILNRYSA
eukprot:CAMPEP_0184383286 /NCGR_PEP_ID=MMETSP0007-20130409/7013_1 /TAXON_ID=97485 /ORGANISM="Prymnesium parvum, Strain Texoma1" /LENGTH=80 /DNA_ID=CAMNT_0026729689 /DNA_START=387 /DNA_END=629 /DNA_ORIENTATION=-